MIEPTQRMGFVIFLVIVTLILLGLWILRLTAREKEEDKETIDNFYAILR